MQRQELELVHLVTWAILYMVFQGICKWLICQPRQVSEGNYKPRQICRSAPNMYCVTATCGVGTCESCETRAEKRSILNWQISLHTVCLTSMPKSKVLKSGAKSLGDRGCEAFRHDMQTKCSQHNESPPPHHPRASRAHSPRLNVPPL